MSRGLDQHRLVNSPGWKEHNNLDIDDNYQTGLWARRGVPLVAPATTKPATARLRGDCKEQVVNFRLVPGYSLDTARPKTLTTMSPCQVDPLGLATGTVRPGAFAACSSWSRGGSRRSESSTWMVSSRYRLPGHPPRQTSELHRDGRTPRRRVTVIGGGRFTCVAHRYGMHFG